MSVETPKRVDVAVVTATAIKANIVATPFLRHLTLSSASAVDVDSWTDRCDSPAGVDPRHRARFFRSHVYGTCGLR